MRWPVRRIAEGAAVAATYAALTLVLAPLSYLQFQVRVAEILKPLVIWNPALIPAFVIGNALSNLGSPFPWPWEMVFMPFANLAGATLAYVLGRRSAYLGAAAYALVTAAAVALMISAVTRAPYLAVFPPLLVSEMILLLVGVPIMRIVHETLLQARPKAAA